MKSDADRQRQARDPWACFPAEYNRGVGLTAGQMKPARGEKPALLWRMPAAPRAYTCARLDALKRP